MTPADIITRYHGGEISLVEAERRLVDAGFEGDTFAALAKGEVFTVRYCHGCGLIRPADANGPCPECADQIGDLMAAGMSRPSITWRPEPCVDPRDIVSICPYCHCDLGDPECCNGLHPDAPFYDPIQTARSNP